MPSSLTWFLSRALVYSTLPPVSVYGTVTYTSTFRSFSWQPSINQSALSEDSTSYRFSELFQRIFLSELPTSFDQHIQQLADLAFCVTPSLRISGTGILNLFPITYAFRPRLRGRLTLGGRTFPRKPWDFGGQDSHLAFRYSYPHNHFCTVHGRFPSRFDLYRTLLYRAPLTQGTRSVGIPFSPDHFRRRTTRRVSYYALFK